MSSTMDHSIEQVFCIYCKKEISNENTIEATHGYHDECFKSIDEYNQQYIEKKKKFELLQQDLPHPFLDEYTFSDFSDFVPILQLEGFRINSIPESISYFQNVNSISFRSNNLSNLPKCLSNFPNLQILNLQFNKFTKIPDVISKCVHLRELWLSNNQLSSLPDDLSNLKHLEILDFRSNNLTEIPDFIINSENTSIKSINIYHKHIKSLPDLPIYNVNILLDISNTLISEFPDISRLRELTSLNIFNTKIGSIPDYVKHIPIKRVIIS